MLKAATLITATAIIAQAARVAIGKDIGMMTTAIPTIGLAPEIAQGKNMGASRRRRTLCQQRNRFL